MADTRRQQGREIESVERELGHETIPVAREERGLVRRRVGIFRRSTQTDGLDTRITAFSLWEK